MVYSMLKTSIILMLFLSARTRDTVHAVPAQAAAVTQVAAEAQAVAATQVVDIQYSFMLFYQIGMKMRRG